MLYVYLVISVLVLDVLGHEPDGVDGLLQVGLLLGVVAEPAVKPASIEQ